MNPDSLVSAVVSDSQADKDMVPAYMDRILPWGEKCRVAEDRLRRAGLRPLWNNRRQVIRKVLLASDEIPGHLDESGRRRWAANEAAYRAFSEFDRDTVALKSLERVLPEDESFVFTCREGLLLGKPERAPISNEVAWVAAYINLDNPPIDKAPSMASLNLAIHVRTNPKWADMFWSKYVDKRLSPGDTSAKAKKKAFVEDEQHQEQDTAAARDASMIERLFGGSDD